MSIGYCKYLQSIVLYNSDCQGGQSEFQFHQMMMSLPQGQGHYHPLHSNMCNVIKALSQSNISFIFYFF